MSPPQRLQDSPPVHWQYTAPIVLSNPCQDTSEEEMKRDYLVGQVIMLWRYGNSLSEKFKYPTRFIGLLQCFITYKMKFYLRYNSQFLRLRRMILFTTVNRPGPRRTSEFPLAFSLPALRTPFWNRRTSSHLRQIRTSEVAEVMN